MTSYRVAFDTETRAFSPGEMAPPVACLTWSDANAQNLGIWRKQILHGTFERKEARALFESWLSSPTTMIVGQHVSFDMVVLAAKWPDLIPAIFRAYAQDRVRCTKLRAQLVDIGTGAFQGFRDARGIWRKHTYDLGFLAKRYLGESLKKDGWRRRYGEFIGTPIEGWEGLAAEKISEAHRELDMGSKDKDLKAITEGPAFEVISYPIKDADSTLLLDLALDAQADQMGLSLEDQYRQARGAFWMQLMSAWGVRTDPKGVAALRDSTEAHVRELERELVEYGLVRTNGTRDTKAATERMIAACEAASMPLRKTANDGVSLDRDACKASGDPVLIAYGDLAQFKAVLTKDVPMLEAGTVLPLHTNMGLAETGRTTSSKPNLQNMRRLPGIREAFRPRPGKVFVQADYPQLELRTLGQVCLDLFGRSVLADTINAGRDPHLAFAANLLGISYEEAERRKKDPDVDNARQIGKVFNFGKPGGLGAEKLVLFARKTYGVKLTVPQVKELSRVWLATLEEMPQYFRWINERCDPTYGADIMQLRSNRRRGGTSYTAACNTLFQGLGADATKAAGFVVAHACYAEPESPLYGSRIVNYIHDEFILEADDDDRVHDVAIELSRLMREVANEWVPDVPFKAPDPEPVVMRIWSKKAEAVYGPDKRLIPWEPKVAA